MADVLKKTTTFQLLGFMVPLVSICPFPTEHSPQINMAIRCSFWAFLYFLL